MSWKKDSGYIGSPASAQTLAVFQHTEPNNDYPPHFMKHLSTHSLDRKSYKHLAVNLLSFFAVDQPIVLLCTSSSASKHCVFSSAW